MQHHKRPTGLLTIVYQALVAARECDVGHGNCTILVNDLTKQVYQQYENNESPCLHITSEIYLVNAENIDLEATFHARFLNRGE